MDNLPDAKSALLSYIDTLLFDGDAVNNEEPRKFADDSENIEKDAVATAELPLRVLLFKVAGIPLAAPLEDIAGVIDVEQTALLRMSSRGGMTIRAFGYRGRDIYALDTREIIFPEGHPARSSPKDAGGRRMLALAGCDWGLLCDEVKDMINLNHQDVEWRMHRSARPWLAGMVKGSGYALVDVKELLEACARRNLLTH